MRYFYFYLFALLSFSGFAQNPVPNMEAVKAMRVKSGDSKFIEMQGYYSQNDGGEGLLELIDKGNLQADYGVYFPAADKNKIWRRVIGSNNVNVRWYGAKADGKNNDAAPLQRALDYAAQNKGSVFFPAGITTTDSKGKIVNNYYNLGTQSLTIKQGVQLAGDGSFASRIKYSGNKSAIILGANTDKGNLAYGIALKNMSILLDDKNATGIEVNGTCGAICENVYIEGPITGNRNSTAVRITGGVASSFFNTFINVICNHVHTGFSVSGQPPMVPTTSLFLNCTSFGDNESGSAGFVFDAYSGEGCNIIGGNIESCDVGIKIQGHGKNITVQGMRFEGNKTDIYNGPLSTGSTFIGCVNIGKVVAEAGTGYDANTFIGCIKPDGSPYNNLLNSSTFIGRKKEDIPLSIINYPLTEKPSLQIANSSNQKIFEVDNNGSISNINAVNVKVMAGNGSPEGRITAPAGSLYMQADGGAGKTLWVKEAGIGSKGWKSK